MKKEKSDQVVQEMMESPLIRHVIACLNPDISKLRKAVALTLMEIGEVAEEELLADWKEASLSSTAEKMAIASALGKPFKELWPQTYVHISEMIATADRSKKPRIKRPKIR